MKKTLYILLVFLGLANLSFGQSAYNLTFSGNADGKAIDTVTQGDVATIHVTVKNGSSSKFPSDGSSSFHVGLNRAVFYGTKADWHSKWSAKHTVDTVSFMALSGFGAVSSSSYKIKIDVDTSYFHLGDNIVIIWPTEGITDVATKKDKIDTSSASSMQLHFYVLEAKNNSGLNEIATDGLNMNIYPNPADNSASINVSGVRSGQLILTDITGKTILHRDIKGDGNSMTISLPLTANGRGLTAGVYFINLVSGNKRCVQKLLITR